MIDRHHLRYFLAVVDQGNFSRGAAACHVSQPTLSVGIAKLEAHVGARLFLRTNRRTQLTAAGVQFAEHARRIEREFAVAEQVARVGKPVRVVRLGVLNTIPVPIVQAAVRAHRVEVPGTQLELLFDGDRALRARLDRGRLDAVLGIHRAGRGFRSTRLLTERYRLALSPDHPLAGRTRIDAGELADNPMIVRRHCEILAETSRHFTAHGVRPFIAARTGNDDQAIACIRAGLGVSVMPESFGTEGIAMPALAGFDPVRTIGIVHSSAPDGTMPAASLDCLGDVVHRLMGDRGVAPAGA